jgi:tetratricopeptide (TPR) repeat protein
MRARAFFPVSVLAGLWIALLVVARPAVLRAAEPEQPPLAASESEPWPLNDEDPESSVPAQEQFARYPMKAAYFMMTVSERAEAALKQKRYESAIKYFRTLARVMPERAVSYARLCEAYEGAGQHDKALLACHEALGKQGLRASDAAYYVRLVLQGSDPLTPEQVTEVDQVLEHLRAEHVDARLSNELDCELALRADDGARLARCSDALLAIAPDSARAASFAWALAVKRQDYRGARRWLARAKAVGADAALLAQMEEGTRGIRSAWLNKTLAIGLGVLLGVAAVAYYWLSRKRRFTEPVRGT